MRTLLIISILVCSALQAFATTQVTVEQLEHLLQTNRNRSDTKLSRQIADLKLSERLTANRFARLEANLPGKRARRALTAVADSAEFLPLPDSDLPSLDAPSAAAQNEMIALTTSYVRNTIPTLPNFLATRVTARFADEPASEGNWNQSSVPSRPMHFVSTSSTSVLNRDGVELADTSGTKENRLEQDSKSLRTSGEFGSILIALITDVFRGKVVWSHWESSTQGTLAVFRFSVPRQWSHYSVFIPAQSADARIVPAYHGEVAIDPTSGTIFRITLEAELNQSAPVTVANLMVEYGPVEIGGKTYACPARSVAYSVVRTQIHSWSLLHDTNAALGPGQTQLNDVKFTNYHLFRAESRILTDDSSMYDIKSSR
jgi:hypothetical protein